MSYIGNQPTQVAFLVDTFTGNSSTTAFTMSVAPANPASIIVAISGVVQDPATYSVGGTTLTFSTAPPTGTGNISVRYLGIPASGVATTAYRTVTNFTATAAQTTFTPPSYTAGFINVYRNGVYLPTADYTATNGTTVVLNNGCAAGDTVTVESFYVSSVLNAIPATTGSVGSAYLASNLSLTSPTLTSPVFVTPASSVITSGTQVTTTSGTSVTFSGIPSWVKRIVIMLNGVSTSSTSIMLMQLGSGSAATSGYTGACTQMQSASGTAGWQHSSYTGFVIDGASNAAAARTGALILSLISSNTWILSGVIGRTDALITSTSGGASPALAGALDRVIITTVNGTDTFDAGAINIQYE